MRKARECRNRRSTVDNAEASKDLHRLINHLEGGLRCVEFRHRGLAQKILLLKVGNLAPRAIGTAAALDCRRNVVFGITRTFAFFACSGPSSMAAKSFDSSPDTAQR